MRHTCWISPLLALALLPLVTRTTAAQRFEFGVGGGGSFYTKGAIAGDSASADAGFQPGFAATAYLGQNLYRYVSGEVRYSFERNTMSLTSGSASATFAGRSHMMHYDLVLHTAPVNAHIRPYVLAGAGIKGYQGTGTEVVFQPLENVALLTKTSQWVPLVTFGAGIKVSVGKRTILRLEFRDYMSPFPADVIAPVPPGKAPGWLHNFVPLAGISFLL